MKNLMRKAILGTAASVMIATTPLAAFAAEEKAEPETTVEVTAEAEEEALDFEKLLADFQEMDDEELCEAVDELFTMLEESPELRGELAVAGLESFGIELTEEDKAALVDLLANVTFEGVVETVQNFDMDQFLADLEAEIDKMSQELLREAACELDVQLEELGQMLIDITEEDIINFFS